MSAKHKKKKYRGFWRFIRIQIFLIVLVVAAIAYYFLGGYAQQISDLSAEAREYARTSNEATFCATQTSIVYDANGNEISILKGEKDVYYIGIEDIPANVTAAIVSIEDKKFFDHNGIDIKAIIRAAWAMVRNGEVTQGGSTITQQLARTVFLNQDKTWQRKMEEIFLAVELEKKYSKSQILEYYLNNIYFGNGYYGIQAASRGYFDEDITSLDLAQVAYLCAIPNNPTLYNPLTNSDKTIERRNRILDNMAEDGKITQTACAQAELETITLKRPETIKNDYVETYTYSCATKALMELNGFEFRYTFDSDEDRQAYDETYQSSYEEYEKTLYTAGYRIYTSIDLNMQQQLQNAIDENLAGFTDTNEEGIYTLQSASVCIDNQTGYVKAIVGGRSQEYNGYTLNRAYQSFRQPGSAIKPLLVYTPILERGYTADSIVTDQAVEGGPANASGSYAGDVTLRSAVERSINTVAWQLFDELTPAVGISYLEEMNFLKLDKDDERLTAALGGFTNGVSPLEMAAGYETIENDGKYREPTCIIKILDAQGNDILITQKEEKQVYKENAARMMTNILEGVMTNGTAAGLALPTTASAGKTGTTNSNKDGWFVGYSKYYTTSVWVGYDIPQELPGLTGASYPGSIWYDYMNQIHEGLSAAPFVAPVVIGEDAGQPVDGEQPADNIQSTDTGVQQDVPAE